MKPEKTVEEPVAETTPQKKEEEDVVVEEKKVEVKIDEPEKEEGKHFVT